MTVQVDIQLVNNTKQKERGVSVDVPLSTETEFQHTILKFVTIWTSIYSLIHSVCCILTKFYKNCFKWILTYKQVFSLYSNSNFYTFFLIILDKLVHNSIK